MIRALAVTVSNRASAGVYSDTSGPVLAELLRSAGCETDGPVVIPDGAAVEATLREAVTSGYDVVVTTGGTTLPPGEHTPRVPRLVSDPEGSGTSGPNRRCGATTRFASAMLSPGRA